MATREGGAAPLARPLRGLAACSLGSSERIKVSDRASAAACELVVSPTAADGMVPRRPPPAAPAAAPGLRPCVIRKLYTQRDQESEKQGTYGTQQQHRTTTSNAGAHAPAGHGGDSPADASALYLLHLSCSRRHSTLNMRPCRGGRAGAAGKGAWRRRAGASAPANARRAARRGAAGRPLAGCSRPPSRPLPSRPASGSADSHHALLAMPAGRRTGSVHADASHLIQSASFFEKQADKQAHTACPPAAGQDPGSSWRHHTPPMLSNTRTPRHLPAGRRTGVCACQRIPSDHKHLGQRHPPAGRWTGSWSSARAQTGPARRPSPPPSAGGHIQKRGRGGR